MHVRVTAKIKVQGFPEKYVMQAVVHMFYQKSIKPTQTSTELENFGKEL